MNPGVLSTTVCAKRREIGNPAPTKAFLQPAKAAACALQLRGTHPPPIPSFLLAPNLSSKRIALTDNMRPKLHDEYTRLWLIDVCITSVHFDQGAGGHLGTHRYETHGSGCNLAD